MSIFAKKPGSSRQRNLPAKRPLVRSKMEWEAHHGWLVFIVVVCLGFLYFLYMQGAFQYSADLELLKSIIGR